MHLRRVTSEQADPRALTRQDFPDRLRTLWGDFEHGVPNGQGWVYQGFIEESNTDTLSSMIDMITILRAYGAVQGSLRTIDGVMDRIANDIGRVG